MRHRAPCPLSSCLCLLHGSYSRWQHQQRQHNWQEQRRSSERQGHEKVKQTISEWVARAQPRLIWTKVHMLMDYLFLFALKISVLRQKNVCTSGLEFHWTCIAILWLFGWDHKSACIHSSTHKWQTCARVGRWVWKLIPSLHGYALCWEHAVGAKHLLEQVVLRTWVKTVWLWNGCRCGMDADGSGAIWLHLGFWFHHVASPWGFVPVLAFAVFRKL